MAESSKTDEASLAVFDEDERSVTSSSVGKYLITYSDYKAFIANDTAVDDIYQHFVRFSLKRKVITVSPSKVISDVTKLVQKLKHMLINDFSKLPNKVSISADISCDCFRRYNFISITCHWLDEEWWLQKKLIAFREFDVEHTATNISNMIHSVLKEYNLVKKISSISFDNIIADKTSLDDITRCSQSSIGCKFVHFRCINHILSLCVQDCLASLKDHISPIRAAISRLTRTISLTDKWIIFCKDHDLKPKKFWLDKPNRWNSTLKMLNDSFEYRYTLCSFFEQQQCGIVLFPSQWDHCSELCELMNYFKEVIVESSNVYQNSWLVVDNCVKIAFLINTFSSSEYLSDSIAIFKERWLQYFLHIPYVFLVAKVLDPREKVHGLEQLLTLYYDLLFPVKNADTPKPDQIACNVKELLLNTFQEYLLNTDVSKGTPSGDDHGRSGSNSGSKPTTLDRYRNFMNSRKRPKYYSIPDQEFEFYLTTCFDVSGPLNVDDWWSERRTTLPVLSLIAKEIMGCPASILSAEQAYSVEHCTLDARRSTLTVEDLENQLLIEDWISSELRAQDVNLETDDEMNTHGDVVVERL